MNEYLITMVNRPDGPFKIKADWHSIGPNGTEFGSGDDTTFFITHTSLICWCPVGKA